MTTSWMAGGTKGGGRNGYIARLESAVLPEISLGAAGAAAAGGLFADAPTGTLVTSATVTRLLTDAHPTLLIAALSHRLAAHLAERLASLLQAGAASEAA